MRVNIETRREFEALLRDMKEASIVVVDTETNGLNAFGDNEMISISVYLPELGNAYNFAYRHGLGRVEIKHTPSNPPGMSFHNMTWSGETRENMFLRHWWSQYKSEISFGNVPVEWLEELKEVWAQPGQLYIFHNAKFDMNFLRMAGFPDPERVHDTMVSLHLVHEDWRHIYVHAPYIYTNTDRQKGLCKKHEIGMWAKELDGSLSIKKQLANRKLKWQSAHLKFPRATEGEQALRNARIEFEDSLTDYIMHNLDDEYNESLVYSKPKKPVRLQKDKQSVFTGQVSKGYVRALYQREDRTIMPETIVYVDKTYKYWEEGFFSIQEDGEVWAVEAEADRIFLREDYNEAFYEMVAYGKQWDEIRKRVVVNEKSNMWMLSSRDVWDYAILDVELTWMLYEWCLPIIEAWEDLDLHTTLQETMYEVAWEMGLEGFYLDTDETRTQIERYDTRLIELEEIMYALNGGEFNPHSWQQLLPFLRKEGILDEPHTDIFPDWYPDTGQVDLEVYDSKPTGTAREKLEPFENHPVIKLVFEMKRLQKSSNVYLKNWLNGADLEGRVHFNMDNTGTAPGRWSSWGKPAGNGQNIPTRNGYRIKEAVTIHDPENWLLLAIDYGQAEARLCSHVGEGLLGFGNHEMTQLFLSGEDMHSYVANALGVQGILYPGMSLEQIAYAVGENYGAIADAKGEDVANAIIFKGYVRQSAKTLNFGLLYKGTEYMMSKEMKIELAPAKVLVDEWRRMFPAFSLAQKHYEKEAMTSRPRPDGTGLVQYVEQPISGRKRKFNKYATYGKRTNKHGRVVPYNPMEAYASDAWNNVIQGLGGHICTVSALRINRKYGDKIKWFATIHDALDGYIRRDSLDILPEVCDIMTDWQVTPKMTVDVEASNTNWQDMQEVKNMTEFIESRGYNGY